MGMSPEKLDVGIVIVPFFLQNVYEASVQSSKASLSLVERGMVHLRVWWRLRVGIVSGNGLGLTTMAGIVLVVWHFNEVGYK